MRTYSILVLIEVKDVLMDISISDRRNGQDTIFFSCPRNDRCQQKNAPLWKLTTLKSSSKLQAVLSNAFGRCVYCY